MTKRKQREFEVSVTRMPRVICAVCGASVFYRPEFTTGAWELAVHVTKAGHAREGPRVPGRGNTRGPS